MKNPNTGIFLSLFILLVASACVKAQEEPELRRTVVSFNLTRLAVSEVNIGFEQFLSSRRSIEFNGGLIYPNDYLADFAVDYTSSPIFSEHGYAGRAHYKIYKSKEGPTKWKDYMAMGISYKHLYSNDNFIQDETVKYDSTLIKTNPVLYKDSGSFAYTEEFLRDENRNKIGVEFLWGKVYDVSNTFAIEFYYGAGIEATMAKHTDYSRIPVYINPKHQWIAKPIPDFTYKSFYLRPVLQIGLTLRIRI